MHLPLGQTLKMAPQILWISWISQNPRNHSGFGVFVLSHIFLVEQSAEAEYAERCQQHVDRDVRDGEEEQILEHLVVLFVRCG